MSKKIEVIKLAAVKGSNGMVFESNPKGMKVTVVGRDVQLTTIKGQYTLTKHASGNYYHGTCNKVNVQIVVKKQICHVKY